MIKFLSRSPIAAFVLLLVLATSSALGARGLRTETKRASRSHAARHHHRRRRAKHGSGSDHASTSSREFTTERTAPTATSALLGNEAVESNRDSLSGGQAEAFPFPARASGAAGAIHVYIDSPNTATTLLVGLYSNADGRPGSLLSKGSLSAPPAGAWDTAPINSTQLVSGDTYWLAVLGTGGTLRYRDRPRGFCRALTSAQTNLETLAATWSTGAVYRTCPVSGYVTAVTSGFPVEPPAPVELTPPPVETTPPPVETTPPPVETTPPPVETTPPPVETTPPPVETTPPPVETTPPPVETTPPPVETTPPPVETTPPPTAGFSYSPVSPVTGQAVTFNGTSSTCPAGPCTYEWSDDGGTTRPTPVLWPLGGGQTLPFTFSGVGTKTCAWW